MFLYPTSRQQIFKNFYPSKNPADTLHLFARILGIGLIFSEYHFYTSDGILFALLDFFIQGTFVSVLFLASLYIMESIVLYNFEYHDEIIKRRNMAYAAITFGMTLSIAFILKTILSIAQESVVILFFLWLFAVVLIGFSTKTYTLISKLPFGRLVIQKNMGISISYVGFIWGWTLIICSSLDHELRDVMSFAVHLILNIMLSMIIFPLFYRGLIFIFKIQDDFDPNSFEGKKETSDIEVGYGVYNGAITLTACFLTTIITGQIDFGTFYPVF
jgi:uncharacterized membrane protein YjfL (UPF0719 family)